MDGDTLARLAYLGLILAALGGWVIVEFRQRMGQALRMAMAWGLIFVAAIGGYGIWNEMKPRQLVAEGGAIEIPLAADGHYYATLRINGVEVPFIVDTGATNMVLNLQDARKLGIDTENLNYFGEASTANGVVRTARVTLDLVELGPFRNEGFRAYVNEGELDGSLLGMDYLRQFQMEIAGEKLILRQ